MIVNVVATARDAYDHLVYDIYFLVGEPTPRYQGVTYQHRQRGVIHGGRVWPDRYPRWRLRGPSIR